MMLHNTSTRCGRTKVLASLAVLACVLIPGALLANQVPAVASRITQPIDESNLVTLKGNRHPLAQARFDQGAAADSMPVNRILVLLQRSPAQEAALRQLLDEQKSSSSPNFHQWLTPAQFGQQFGPSDSDIATVTSWLQSHGFTVNRVSAGRTVIEISGTAGQVRNAFHTEIHQYAVNGESHWANNADPQIPAALKPVFAGFVSLNNFPKKALHETVGRAQAAPNPETKKPELTGTCTNFVTQQSVTCYVVAPYDFATIYNSLPLWNATPSIDGTGETIAIVAQSDICAQTSPDFTVASACNNRDDVADFRSAFGLPATLPGGGQQTQVILDGPNPGLTGDEIEADLDTEWSGAVARNAKVDVVVSETTEVTAGIDLSAEYIVDNNLAPQMSESYGACEAELGLGVGYYEAIWEQASAEGMTVVISAGDSGSAGCDDDNTQAEAIYGLAVNGIASTPFNVVAGGTDFNDAGNPLSFWNTTNNNSTEPGESARGYIPEIPWNDSCAAAGAAACSSLTSSSPLLNIIGGGGGESACAALTTLFNDNGYSAPDCVKPAWQSGAAVTGSAMMDGVRDSPDLSLFAAAGSASNSAYLVCESDAVLPGTPPVACNAPGGGFILVGGTSSSAPAFAGTMAMVNQFMSLQTPPLQRQGNAGYELYSLASAQVTTPPSGGCNSTSSPNVTNTTSCVFYDITTGNNSVPCAGGSPNCSNTSSLSTTPGVLDVPNSNGTNSSVLGWTAGTGYDLATGLGSLNIFNLVHAWPSAVGHFTATTTTLQICTGATDTTTCTPLPPTGTVTIAHGSQVWVNAAVSPAPPTWSNVKPEDVALIGTPNPLPNNGGSASAGADRFSADGGNVDAYGLTGGNTNGEYTYFLIGGTYTLTAHYTGDGTNGASDSAGISLIVTPENSTTSLSFQAITDLAGDTAPVTSVPYGTVVLVRVDVFGTTLLPVLSPPATVETASGTVTVTDSSAGTDFPSGNYVLNTEGNLEVQTALNQIPAINASATAHSFTAAYQGDDSYNSSSTTAAATLTVSSAATTTVVTSSALQFAPGGSVTLTATVTANTLSLGNAPNGTVTFFANGTALSGAGVVYARTPGNFLNSQLAFITATLAYMPSGTTSITAVYNGDTGDTNYAASPTSATITLTPGAVASAANSTVIGAPASVVANNSTTSTITVTLKDASSNPVSGKTVILGATAANSSTLVSSSGASSASGVVTFTVKDSTPETVTYTATDTTDGVAITQTAAVTYTPTYTITSANSSSATAVPISAPGGSGQSTLMFTLGTGTTTVTLSYAVQPIETDPPTCTFMPSATVTANGNVTLMCGTTAASRIPPAPLARPSSPSAPLMWLLATMAALLAMLLLLAIPERRRGYALLILLLVITAGAAVACGGGGGGAGGGGGGGNAGTTPGIYAVAVNGSIGGGQPVIVYFNVE